MKGKFIVIYGINNIGKTVQSKRLVGHLRRLRKKAIYVKYPVYRMKPTGPLLDKILRSGKKQKISEEELQLLFVLNRYQFQPTLLRWLREGKYVVAEDYRYTGVAWGVAKGASQRLLENMNKFLVQEDVAILMEGARKLSALEKNHIHETRDALVSRCAKVFRSLAKKYGWKKVQVSPDKDETERRLWDVAKKAM